jgi:hypothetical protein
VAAALNTLPKYVASTTLTSADWSGTTILRGDLVTEVTKLEDQPGGELQVHGSGGLAQTLIAADLIDEYRLLFYPVHLGSGRKLFRDGAKAASLRLRTSSVTSTGVVIASPLPAESLPKIADHRAVPNCGTGVRVRKVVAQYRAKRVGTGGYRTDFLYCGDSDYGYRHLKPHAGQYFGGWENFNFSIRQVLRKPQNTIQQENGNYHHAMMS